MTLHYQLNNMITFNYYDLYIVVHKIILKNFYSKKLFRHFYTTFYEITLAPQFSPLPRLKYQGYVFSY